MIARIMTAAVLSTGIAVLFSPAFAQTATGTTGGTMTTSPSGTMTTTPSGTMTTTPSGTMGTTSSGTMSTSPGSSTTMGATANAPAANPPAGTMQGSAQPRVHHVNQAQAQRRMASRGGNDSAERQVTQCLNNAAAQHTSFDACKR